MTAQPLGTFSRLALRFVLPVGVAFAALVVVNYLFHPRPAVSEGLGAVFVVFVLGYSLFMGRQEVRRLDEVQRANVAFAHSNGWVWGGFATILLLMVPWVGNRIVDQVIELGARSPDLHFTVRLALSLAVCLVMVMQTLAIAVASFVWRWRMRGSGDSS